MGEDHETGMEGEGVMHFIDPMQGDKLLGAFRVASGVRDAVVLVHAPVGCHWGVNLIERLSSIRTNATISALRERSVIFGGHENLEKAIRIIFKGRKRRYLILLAASVPSIIGDDWQGVLDSIYPELCYLALDCGGYMGRMADGYEECMEELSKWMDCTRPEDITGPPMVNIMGIQRDTPRGSADISELRRMLGLLGIKINSVFPPSSLAEIKRSPRAHLNVLLGYGMGLAREMEERWGIPWVLFEGYPYGLSGSARFVRTVANNLGIEKGDVDRVLEREREKVLKKLLPANMYLPALYGTPVAISGDLAQVFGMAYFLAQEIGCKIKIANVTSAPSWAKGINDLKGICDNVLFQRSWHEFERLLENMDVSVILGGELEIKLSHRLNIAIIPFSYPTLSKVVLTSVPYIGFMGSLTLVEDLINRIT